MFSIIGSYWLLALSRINSAFGSGPHCIGNSLKPDQFSKPGDVGFVRDVCVDIVARNIYNNLGFPVSKLCEELAKVRTSCSSSSFKCLKLKRLNKRFDEQNEKKTNKIMEKAVILMIELLDVVSSNMPENTYMSAGESVYENIKDAKCRLIDSGAAAENSMLTNILEDLKMFLCKHCTVSDNQDVKDAIHQFFSHNFHSGIKVSVTNIEDMGHATITGLFRLIFNYGEGTNTNTQTGSVILKVPSLAPFYNTRWKLGSMYAREAAFYASILPTLYSMGRCKPFAPRVFAVTQGNALVLEDLTNTGYISLPRLDSLDINHSMIFINMLAQYHALSYVHYHSLDENDSIKQLIGPENKTVRRAIEKDEFDHLCKIIKPLLSETLYKKVLRAENEMLAQLPMQNKNDPNSINVIMHGDLHRQNFLFNYDSSGRVSGIKLLDWQGATVGNPALDLIEFFIHNLHEELFQASEDYLLEYYIATFNHNLSSVQSNRSYNRLELNRDMKFFKYYYFRVLYDITIYWGASYSTENYDFIAKNIANWIIYLEKKGYF